MICGQKNSKHCFCKEQIEHALNLGLWQIVEAWYTNGACVPLTEIEGFEKTEIKQFN